MPKKRPKRIPDEDGDGCADLFTLPELVQIKRLVVTYNPITDTVEIDDRGMSPLEMRALLISAAEQFADARQD